MPPTPSPIPMRMGPLRPLFINQDEDVQVVQNGDGHHSHHDMNVPKMGIGIRGDPTCSGDIHTIPIGTSTGVSNGSLLGLVKNKPSNTLTMLSCASNSSSSADSGCHPSGNFEEPETVTGQNRKETQKLGQQPFFRGGSGLITKYLVLLQDCLAIKFVAVGQGQNRTGSQGRLSQLRPGQGPCQGQGSSRHSLRRSFVFDGEKELFTDEDVSDVPLSLGDVGLDSIITKSQPQPIQGIQLYKSFLEANLKCYWNATLCEAIRSLEYKGWLIPSTILVGVSGPCGSGRVSLIRTAWARKMLRHPPGFRIEFIGEIEEIIAEPASQGQFAPLSDSLCWAILELTSSGQEAFVDSILHALANAFPLMSLPPRELVYTTLERLIRDRKIYQTSQGYFIVSPDTFRYMSAGGEGQGQGQGQGQNYSDPRTLPLDALTASYYDGDIDADKLSQHSYSSGGCDSREDLLVISSSRSGGDQEIFGNRPLKRHNSLRVIRQRDLDLLTPTMGARSLSFRLAKTKSLLASEHHHYADHEALPSRNGGEGQRFDAGVAKPGSSLPQKDAKSKKPSFFRRFFFFRRSTSGPSEVKGTKNKNRKSGMTSNPKNKSTTAIPPPNHLGQNPKQMSLQNLQRSPKIYAQLPPRKISPAEPPQAPSAKSRNRSYEDILEDEIIMLSSSSRGGHGRYRGQGQSGPMSKWNSLPSSTNGRRSRRSILNESPFYDVLHFNLGPNVDPDRPPPSLNQQQILRNGNSRPSSSLGPSGGQIRGQPQRERPLSMGVYGGVNEKSFETLEPSRGPPSLQGVTSLTSASADPRRRSLPRIDSPSPSVSAIYASIGGGGGGGGCGTASKSGGGGGGIAAQIARKKAGSLPPPGPVPTTVNLRGRSNRYPPWRPRSAYELLAYQNLQNSKKLSQPEAHPQRKSSLGSEDGINGNISRVSSHYHVFKPSNNANANAQTSRATIKSRTELQVQIPLGKVGVSISNGQKTSPPKNPSVEPHPPGAKVNSSKGHNTSSIITSTSTSVGRVECNGNNIDKNISSSPDSTD